MKAEEAKIIKRYEAMVHSLVTKVMNEYGLEREREDLFAYGIEGLLQSWRRYDPTRGAAFQTYAYYRVRGAIIDGARTMGMRGPRRRKLQTESISNELQLEACQQPPQEGLKGLSERLDAMVTQTATIFLLVEGKEELIEQTASPDASPEEEVERQNMRKWVRDKLARLDERSRIILERYFYDDWKLDDIAESYGYSRSWASRARSAALRKLGRALQEEF